MSSRRIAVFIRPAFALVLITACGFAVRAGEAQSSAKEKARQILQAAEVEGGLICHLGCGDGKLTAAFRTGESCLVHGLDGGDENVDQARRHVQSLGLYGKVSVDRFDGKRLPYVDNLVNLVVAADPGAVPMEEVVRVLCPSGVALVAVARGQGPDVGGEKIEVGGKAWTKIVKPRPEAIDEWTHYLHDPTNNAVAHDTVIDFPRHLQWLGGPKWSRHHDHMSSATAMVSSGGRNFCIFDEGAKLSIQLPSQWFLIARDAFNGKILWKRPISTWHPHIWSHKSGPAQLPRRLVAVGDTVYATLSLDAPLEALDAATGRTIRTYAGTRATDEILYSDGVLFLVVDDSHPRKPADPTRYNYRWSPQNRRIMAVDAQRGEVRWQKRWKWVVPVTLAVDSRRVLFFDGWNVVCLDRGTGVTIWQSDQIGTGASVPTCFAPTLVAYDDVVLFSGSDTGTKEYAVDNGLTLTALDASTGRTLWTAEHPPSGYRSPEDVFVVDELVWTAPLSRTSDSGVFTGRDLKTGEVKVEFPPDVQTYWFHHRCHRAKATDNYILTSRTGIEFVDFRAKHWTCHHWARGACLYGIMPANGMIYNPPHPCACYLEAKLFGFNALASARGEGRGAREEGFQAPRLEPGPAYDQTIDPQSSMIRPTDWPTYRHDSERSGFTEASVPAELKQGWQSQLGGRLSSVVVAAGKLFVASVDEHTVHALDAESGVPVWSCTVGGRVDSPPTICQGRVLFGSADGYVYALRASDGALIWRFRAAPVDRRLVAFEQVESVWPVHGSVLVQEGVVWCVAGRSMFLDGGLRLLKLDVSSGKKLAEQVFNDRDPELGENLQVRVRGLNMPVALPDILVSDGQYVYLKSQRLDQQGRRLEIDAPTRNVREQKGEGMHLFCPAGFLDDSYWHRSYWVYGRRWRSGASGYYQAGRYAPSGRLLVFDESTVYGFSRKRPYFRWTTPIERQLFASGKAPEIVRVGPPPGKGFSAQKPPDVEVAWNWAQDVPFYAKAMVLAGQTLFVAGPPDLVDEERTLQAFADPAVQTKLAQQSAALDGARGALLWAVSTADGRKLADYELDGLPVFDGMAAAAGRLYLATTDGNVLCFTAR